MDTLLKAAGAVAGFLLVDVILGRRNDVTTSKPDAPKVENKPNEKKTEKPEKEKDLQTESLPVE